jgi:hypothetical protein
VAVTQVLRAVGEAVAAAGPTAAALPSCGAPLLLMHADPTTSRCDQKPHA